MKVWITLNTYYRSRKMQSWLKAKEFGIAFLEGHALLSPPDLLLCLSALPWTSIHPSIHHHPLMHPPFGQSIHPSPTHPPIHQSVHPSINLSINPFLLHHPSTHHPPIHPSICPHIHKTISVGTPFPFARNLMGAVQRHSTGLWASWANSPHRKTKLRALR